MALTTLTPFIGLSPKHPAAAAAPEITDQQAQRFAAALERNMTAAFRSKYLLHVIGTGATAIVAAMVLGEYSAAPERLTWWVSLQAAMTLLLFFVIQHEMRRPPPSRRVQLDPRSTVVLLSATTMGSIVWFDLASLSSPTYAYALCACLMAFCAGSFVNLAPLSFLIRLTIFPVLLQLALGLTLAGQLRIGIAAVVFLAIVGGVPLREARLHFESLIALTEQESWRAEHDPLTGLLNRAGVASLDPSNATVLYLDLNGFKAVNDEHGHAAGDLVLQETATRLQAATAKTEASVARFGGDEFLIVLDETDRAEVNSVVSNIVASMHQPFSIGQQVRMSMGIAHSTMDTDFLAAVRHADRALYEAKADPMRNWVWSRQAS